MNTKQVAIQKKIGEHIAALHSLYEEFQRADDAFDNPTAQLQAAFAKMSPKQRERIANRVLKKVYGKKE
jgi:hypothetical protein